MCISTQAIPVRKLASEVGDCEGRAVSAILCLVRARGGRTKAQRMQVWVAFMLRDFEIVFIFVKDMFQGFIL